MYRLLQASALEAFDFPLISKSKYPLSKSQYDLSFFGILGIISYTGKYFLTLTPILQKLALVVSKMDLPERRNPRLCETRSAIGFCFQCLCSSLMSLPPQSSLSGWKFIRLTMSTSVKSKHL